MFSQNDFDVFLESTLIGRMEKIQNVIDPQFEQLAKKNYYHTLNKIKLLFIPTLPNTYDAQLIRQSTRGSLLAQLNEVIKKIRTLKWDFGKIGCLSG